MRVAVVTGPDAGHAFPVVAIARALRDRDHEVLVATGTQWQDALAADGLAFVEIPLLAPTAHDADVGYRLWRRAGQMAPPLAERLRPFDPEVVIADTLTRAGALAADLLRVPWIETSPHFLYDPDPEVPPIGMGAARPRSWVGRANQASIRRRQAASVAQGEALHQQVRTELGLEGPGLPGARMLATLPALEPHRRTWPARTFLVGSLPWEPPTWPVLAAPDGTGPLVLVSDSTASEVTPSIADVALQWLHGASDLRGVVTTAAVPAASGTRVVVGRGSHVALMPSVDLVVSTAGHGLVTKALTAGVPVVLIPQQGDQFETAARVERAGLGRRIPQRHLTPGRLDRVVREVLGDRTTVRNLQDVSATARRLGPRRAAAVVESLVAANSRSGASSTGRSSA